MAELVTARPMNLPVGPTEESGVGWNGLLTLIATEAALFGFLLFSYYYIGASATLPWIAEARPSLTLAAPNTIILLTSSLFVRWGEGAIRQGRKGAAMAGSGIAFLLGSAFAIIQLFEWKAKSYGLGTSSFASLYFVTTGFHMAHVIVGLVALLMLFVWTWRDYFSPTRRIVYTNGAYYWHFVDAVWLFVFATYYITPYLGFGR
jgi:cytochrome c oxidase subunit III